MVHGSRLSGCGRAQGILFSDVGAGELNVGAHLNTLPKISTAISMKELRAILSAGSELRLRSDTEVHLRSALSTVRRLFREAERVMNDTNEMLYEWGQETNVAGPSKFSQALSVDVQTQSQSRIAPGLGKSSCLLISQTQSPAKKVGGCTGMSATTSVVQGRVDDDDEEEDEEFTSKGKKGSGEARSGVKSKTPLHLLSDLLSALDRLPPGVFAARDLQYSLSSSPVTALRELYDTSVELKERIDAVLDRAAVARVLKPK